MTDIKQLKAFASELSVLYVEDDEDISKSMQRYLQKMFLRVVSAKDGQEGLDAYNKEAFDIVITDLSMPTMNGIEFIDAVKKINTEQMVLITTAHSETYYLIGAVKLHVDGYILKPFDYNELNFELFKIAEKIYKYKENEKYKKNLQNMLEQRTAELDENYNKTIYSMVDLIERRDAYTAGHSKRVARYARMIAQEMGYTKEECDLVYKAGILHDIGKIETPDAILLKPGQLTELEYKLIKEHVSVGYDLLRQVPMFEPLAPIVYAHHERYDGSGYPQGLQANEIMPLARVMMVADTFDAMSTNRIYKVRKSVEESLAELKSLSGIHFHPEVVAAALSVLQDVTVEEDRDQFPKTQLEAERFAYFYKDRVTSCYNKNYLEIILLRNRDQLKYRYMFIVSLSHFTLYNKKYGWDAGDRVLREFGNILISNFQEELVFRVFGDDFVVFSQEELFLAHVKEELDSYVAKLGLNYRMNYVSVKEERIKYLSDIEALC